MPRILLTGEAEGALTLDELRARAARRWPRIPHYMTRFKAEVTPADHAILYLTSGATGEPKMALVTHPAVVANIDMAPAGAAARAEGCHGGVPALGAHCAARGDGVAAHAPGHAGDFRREPAQAAAGYPDTCGPTMFAGAAAHVGAHLLHHLHGAAQAAGGGAQGVLWRAGTGPGGGPLQAPGQARAAAHPRSAEAGRPAILSESARAFRRTAALGGFRRGAARAKTWPNSTKPSACR